MLIHLWKTNTKLRLFEEFENARKRKRYTSESDKSIETEAKQKQEAQLQLNSLDRDTRFVISRNKASYSSLPDEKAKGQMIEEKKQSIDSVLENSIRCRLGKLNGKDFLSQLDLLNNGKILSRLSGQFII